MRPISAVIITLNEERNLARCLASLQGVANEVMVLDSHSTDRTVHIAEGFGARVIAVDWKGYAETKNTGNLLAQHDLILSIDADEVLSPELAASINRAKLDEGVAYTMNRLNNYCGTWVRHTGWYPDRKLRLFDRRHLQWHGSVHETLGPRPKIVPHLNGDLLHYSYATVAEHLAQTDKFTTLSACEMFDRGVKFAAFRLLLSPMVAFAKYYFIKLGFLDGWAGLSVSAITAYGTALKYYKLLRLKWA